jgi:hypothetical protein
MTEKELLEKLMIVDPMVWAHTKQLNLRDGYKFSLKGMQYILDIITCEKKIVNCKKGAQMCLTTAEFIKAIHACKFRKYEQNIMYMMPSVTAVERLSKVSFDPIFRYNPWIMRKGDTNTTMCKEVNGRSIVMVGAQPKHVGNSNTKDTDNLRSIPCDEIIRDELDLMDMDMVYMSKQRLKRSKFGRETNFASPTYPGYGIDKCYEDSDQRRWQIKCRSCGKHTCLVTSFPDSILQKDGVWYRACVHCQAEVFIADGGWQTDFPERREAGFWVSGLLSPLADLDEYMYQYNNIEGAQMSEFMRSTLGVATTEAENQLNETTVLSRAGSAPNQMISTGETCMGVDVGKKIHAVTGIRTSRNTYEILNVSMLDTMEELHDLAQKMNVHSCVIDSGPYDHGVREFQKAEPYTIYLCQYSESQPGKPKFDSKSGMVKVNRNEWMDNVHTTFTKNKIIIPRPSVMINEYAREMTKTAKTVVTSQATGLTKPLWIKMGADHFYHSTLYFLLAANRSSPRQRDGTGISRPTHAVNTFI